MPTTKTKNGTASPRHTMTPADAGGTLPVPTFVPGGEGIALPVSDSKAGPGMPELTPPGEPAAQAASAATTTQATVTGLWTSDNANNAYCYLDGKGWRKLSPSNATSHEALLALARLAKDAGAAIQCEEDGTVIHEMYVW